MRRRAFIAALGSAPVWPVVTRAQQPTVPVIGYIGSSYPEAISPFWAAFHLGLTEVGFVEDQTVMIESRWAHGQNDRLPALAADLVRRQVAVIVTSGLASALAAKAATQTIPVVFLMGSNAVETGLVESYNHPGRNLTGVAVFSYVLIAKRLQFLHEVVPIARRSP
jgi:putative tryptophan/tyrosine transport system substrate-binding protein